MKRLILVRHGKSSWKYDVPDDERPLKKRAFKDADLVIKALKNLLRERPVLWSSHAIRALETAKIFANKFNVPDEQFSVKEELYNFDKNKLQECISSCEDTVQQLMIFSHNPGITELANTLGSQKFENVPTTGVVVIDFEADSWKNLSKGQTLLYLFPKNLR